MSFVQTLLVGGLIMQGSVSRAQETVIYETGFESSVGFISDQGVGGQNGWLVSTADAASTSETIADVETADVSVGGQWLTFPLSNNFNHESYFVWRPIVDTIAVDERLTFSFKFVIPDFSGDDNGSLTLSIQGTPISCSFNFLGNFLYFHTPDGVGDWTPLLTPGQLYEAAIIVDYERKTLEATLDGVLLFNQDLGLAFADRTLSSLAILGFSNGDSNDLRKLIFDDFRLSKVKSDEIVIEPVFIYRTLEDGLEIIDYTGSEIDIVVPQEIEGNTVVKIGEAFRGSTTIESIVLPDTVVEIVDHAFQDCISLKSLKLSEALANLGVSSFEGCTALDMVTLPDSLEEIPLDAFSGCTSLTTIKLPQNLTAIDSSVFKNCTNLGNIVLPSSLLKIGAEAFSGCIALEEILIPESVTELHGSVFSSCTSLRSVNLPLSTTIIPLWFFSGCSSLETVALPNGLLEIGPTAFNGCESLQTITIPATVRTIGERAFEDCATLESLSIPEGIEELSASVLASCMMLSEVILPTSLKTISERAFSDCQSLGMIDLPSGLETIGNYAFENCLSLSEIDIPSTVHTIGIGFLAGCVSIEEISIGDLNPHFSAEDGILFSKDKDSLISFPAKRTGSYQLEESIVSVNAYAFHSSKLSMISLPDELEFLGDYAFAQSLQLVEIELPVDLDRIPNGLFQGCSGLIEISFPPGLTRIGKEAFFGCTNLNAVQLPETVSGIGAFAFASCESLTELRLPASISFVGMGAFAYSNNLKSIRFAPGETPLTIDFECFADCGGLEEVVFPPLLVAIDSAFRRTSNLKRVYFLGGEPRYVSGNGRTIFGDSTNQVFILSEFAATYDRFWEDEGEWEGRPFSIMDEHVGWLLMREYPPSTVMDSQTGDSGHNLLVEYAFGLSQDRATILETSQVENEIEYRFFGARTDVEYTWQVSTNLVDWNSIESALPAPNDDGIISLNQLVSGEQAYGRVKVGLMIE